MDAFEEAFDLLGVEALVDGLLVRVVFCDDSGWGEVYLVRLRMRSMNFGMLVSFDCSFCIIVNINQQERSNNKISSSEGQSRNYA